MFQCSKNLLIQFYYKIKQPNPPTPVFVQVVEVIQNLIFHCFAPWLPPPDLSTFYATDLREILLVSLK